MRCDYVLQGTELREEDCVVNFLKNKINCTKNVNYVLIFVKVEKNAVDTAYSSKSSVANSDHDMSEVLGFLALVSPGQGLQVSRQPHGQRLSPVIWEKQGCNSFHYSEDVCCGGVGSVLEVFKKWATFIESLRLENGQLSLNR